MSSCIRSISSFTDSRWCRTCSLRRIVSRILSVVAHSLIVAIAVIIFVLRLGSQVQLASPRRIHPTRSLRFFVAGWAVVNATSVVLHSIEGSSGTKGEHWAGKGIILDFIGQGSSIHTVSYCISTDAIMWIVAYYPSTLRLVLLDLVIAFLQFVVLIVAFGEAIRPTPTPTTEETSDGIEGEDTRTIEELSALLGEEFEEDEPELLASSSSFPLLSTYRYD